MDDKAPKLIGVKQALAAYRYDTGKDVRMVQVRVNWVCIMNANIYEVFVHGQHVTVATMFILL